MCFAIHRRDHARPSTEMTAAGTFSRSCSMLALPFLELEVGTPERLRDVSIASRLETKLVRHGLNESIRTPTSSPACAKPVVEIAGT